LADYLCDGVVSLSLDARKRDEAIRTLLELFVTNKLMATGATGKAMTAVLAREALGSTAIGRGAAVPHARVEGLDRILMAFGYSVKGVEFSALDGQPVHEVFLVIAPPSMATEYMDVLQRISRLVQDDDFRRFVARVKNRQEAMDLIKEMDK